MTIVRVPAVETNSVIAKVHVRPGSRLSAGDPLVTLEMPSIYWDVDAPFGGFVHGLYRGVGQRVAEGLPLASVCDSPLPTRLQAPVHSPVQGQAPVQMPLTAQDQEPIHAEIARIMEESARQAIWEVELEIKAAGEQWTPEQIFARQQLRTIALFMPASNSHIASIRERTVREDLAYQLDALNDSLKDAAWAVEQRPPSKTSLDQLVDVWRRHPFLVGWLGADLVHKLRAR